MFPVALLHFSSVLFSTFSQSPLHQMKANWQKIENIRDLLFYIRFVQLGLISLIGKEWRNGKRSIFQILGFSAYLRVRKYEATANVASQVRECLTFNLSGEA